MSHQYRGVGWTRQKKRYDAVVVVFVALYLSAFGTVTLLTQPHVTIETVIIRAFGSLAFVLLTLLLLIGPLARLDRRFLPLLYNRRHLGVATFFVALVHGIFALIQFHFLGELNPIVSVLVSDGSFAGDGPMPFQPFGVAALVVLFLMAATSHDFWLANLGPALWKSLHMAVYPAYVALVAHVAFGALQSEGKAYLWPMVGAAVLAVFGTHVWAAVREAPGDRPPSLVEKNGRVRLVAVDRITDGRAVTVTLGRERVAVFRNGTQISCVSNVCRHQMGPLGEGRIIDGCITCPWHGYQYDPVTGCSPPPFTERIETWNVTVEEGYVWADPEPNPLGTPAEVGTVPEAGS
ncbi:MAG: Rieske 2Fe-2S domain-containing protein [Gemmatimonadetes bacterium]|nr:Rieske 2Fe-2S domain-containing protein [Gemmatimonadota bacterium]